MELNSPWFQTSNNRYFLLCDLKSNLDCHAFKYILMHSQTSSWLLYIKFKVLVFEPTTFDWVDQLDTNN